MERPVLIIGERGTGKELAARRLHYLSHRWQNPLVTLNCAALSPSLLEAELFGHETGAFTGATRTRPGRFESAHAGTLFLDEIGLVPMVVQEKILRVVEYGHFERVGSSAQISVNVRIVAATNADLPRMAHAGTFKQDLLDRLSFEVLSLPALRDRRDDILPLARHFANGMALELGFEQSPQFSDEAASQLESHRWPGNVRELKNVAERAVYRSGGGYIEHIDFDPFDTDPTAAHQDENHDEAAPVTPTPPAGFTVGSMPLHEAVAALESGAVQYALRQSRFHQGKAARLLGLSYDQFRRLHAKYR